MGQRVITIRKLKYDEAKVKLEREMNEAFLAGEEFVDILHGIGEGILKRMAEDYVSQSGFSKLVSNDPMFRQNPGITTVQLFPPSNSKNRAGRF